MPARGGKAVDSYRWSGAAASTPSTTPAKSVPTVDLSQLVKAAKIDPKAKQGHKTYAADGSYGTLTLAAYAQWQRHLGYKGKAADGVPGIRSLTALGKRHGFKVVA
ncbi:hypothetical protein [Streptomyces sp. NPDC057580]|uniref:hypothetical protein n=1 Tax=Streptomyces sp. NPDC057580 TaxID=3346173 RepID=UPI00367F383A